MSPTDSSQSVMSVSKLGSALFHSSSLLNYFDANHVLFHAEIFWCESLEVRDSEKSS
jgi:hypothetical protein